MPNDNPSVPVMLVQLRTWEWPQCPECAVVSYGDDPPAHPASCALGNAIRQAERLRDWRPKVGDRVRLRAMPEKIGTITATFDGLCQVMIKGITGLHRHLGVWRYPDELMPAEEQ